MPIRRHADLWVQLGLCWIFFVVLVADQAHLQNTELKAHYTFFCTCSQYRLSLLFQPIKAYCHGCPAITGLVQLSSHYRLLLAKLLFAFAIFGRPNAMQKKIPMKLPRQCLNLCILLHLSMFQCMAGQENQARDSGDSPTLEGWGILSGFFFGTLSKKNNSLFARRWRSPSLPILKRQDPIPRHHDFQNSGWNLFIVLWMQSVHRKPRKSCKMRHWILLCPASLHFLESSTCQGATAVAIDWLLLQGQHSMMFFAKNEKYSHVLQVFFSQYRLELLHWRQCNHSSQYRLQFEEEICLNFFFGPQNWKN